MPATSLIPSTAPSKTTPPPHRHNQEQGHRPRPGRGSR
ncbi:hypothetical protein H206_05386 [Candidatus Electrothrix aarhusensis]|uniref:Uncharacterized protein n=1 Tax=Candidatus Electrothrix aarhusensis TaxID=1859131 RepID=A0A444J4M7_9BACT|nr:hypothetical protein H206_05386 [Candidatus Electrothrix aarhusensis]